MVVSWTAMRIVRRIFAVVALCVMASGASANLIVNGDFESGTFNGWSAVNQISTSFPTQAVLYTSSAGSNIGGLGNLVPTYAGGLYGGLARPGSGIDVGFEQTISVLTGVEIGYSVDFAVRETQIPGEGRARQVVSLRLNGILVSTFDSGAALTTMFSSFVSTFIPTTNLLTFSITSLRSTNFGTGWGQFFIDNVVVTQEETSSTPEPTSLVLMSLALLGLGFSRRKKYQ